MYVIGTAGHVDHGKSTLVNALTGIDPDRLEEEKRRGMTIDLGFAWLTLPSGREVSIVDVPGHERFIKNMLAGVGGIDLALLIVAADESVMPQTREHLAILDLLGVRRGLAVVTKRDLVDEEWLGLVQLEVEEMLEGTTLEDFPVLPVSATTGEGLPELLAAVDDALHHTEQRRDVGRPRLAVDRSFAISGFGTVVTGTLIDGTLQVGQAVDLAHAGKQSRVRGLQTHRRKVEQALPGTRVAVNLGGISHDEVERGEVVTTPGWLRPSQAIDVRLNVIKSAPRPLKHNAPILFHAHTRETAGRVRLLDTDEVEPGSEAWAQIWVEQPVAMVRGDRFVLRSTDTTVGGGVVVDTHARRHRRRHAGTIARLETLAQGSPAAQLLSALEGNEPAEIAALARRANVAEEEALNLAREGIRDGSIVALGEPLAANIALYSATTWSRLSGKAQQTLAGFHQQSPLRAGMPREEFRSRLGLNGNLAQSALGVLARSGVIVDDGGSVRLPDHRVILNEKQQSEIVAYLAALERDPFPAASPAIAADLLALLIEQGRAVKATEGVIFDAATYARLKSTVVEHLQASGKVTVAEVRDMFNTSRKYALALLEHLDEEHVTRRVGDERVLLRA